ncbi:MAG: Clp1/GlmU family protein [Actinomycetota bacterium]
MDAYESLIARIVGSGGLAVALGGMDSGKSTFCKMVAAVAVRVGRTVAYIDTDVSQSTIGPPTTIGLKYVTSDSDLEPDALSHADLLYFVGSVIPQGHLLPLVVGSSKMAEAARAHGVDIILVDTTGLVGGTLGQVLKYHKVEVLRPDLVIGFQRGEELEPILGAIRRAFPFDVVSLPVPAEVKPTSVDARITTRQDKLQAAFEQTHRWKVKMGIFIPTVPPDLDPSLLDGILVGLEDGAGHCVGLGILEYREGQLVMRTSAEEGAKALRIGSTRVAADYSISRVDLRDLFVSE